MTETTRAPERKGVWASAAAVGAAVLASACCLGPAILLALGIGGLGFASALEPFRPWFLALTALFLGGAFYLAYRPQPACAADASCTPASRRRMRIVVWLAAILALGAAAYPHLAGARAQRQLSAQPMGETAAKTHEVELIVRGMTCSACATHIQESLEAVPGVEEAAVRYPEGDATVRLSGAVSPDRLIEAVQEAGYDASVTSRSSPQGGGPSNHPLDSGSEAGHG